ncbi:hypothetical protein ACSVH5_03525 [Flavobacterium sp. RSSA_27]|uniref:hypothetical protein n=1 Tax=Flavobacterium sp. RSSA_27 TaxID=3447667 RepID=UPI003F402903
MKSKWIIVFVFSLSYIANAQDIASSIPHFLPLVGQNDVAINEDFSMKNNFIKNKSEQAAPWFVERFKVTAGFYGALNNTTVSLDGTNGEVGTAIDFERDLGFSKQSPTYLLGFDWHISKRSKFVINYYNLNRSADYKLKKEINFGDQTFQINADINAYFNTTIYRLSYGYAFLSRPKYEVGLNLGSHIVGASTGISLNNKNGTINVSERFGFTAPLPDIGIWGGWAITDRWALTAEYIYFLLQINEYQGSIKGFDTCLTYRVVPKLDISAGITSYAFNLKMERKFIVGHLEWGNEGVFIKAAYSFGHKKWQ